MRIDPALDLIVFGVLLLILSFLGYWMAPGVAAPHLPIGIIGGTVSALLGLLRMHRRCSRFWPVLTLVFLAVLLGTKAIMAWKTPESSGLAIHALAMTLTIVSVFAVGQAVTLLLDNDGHPGPGES